MKWGATDSESLSHNLQELFIDYFSQVWYPAGTLAQPLQTMETAWRAIGHGDLAKKSVNSLIGLWCIDQCYVYKCLSSLLDDDCPPGALKSVFLYEGGVINDFVTKELVCNGGISSRPLHDIAMAQEHVRLGTALYVLKRLRAPAYEIKTDSILYRAPKRAKVSVANLTYANLHNCRDTFEGHTGARRLDKGCSLPPWRGEGEVFRVETAQESDRLRCDPKKPTRPHTLRILTATWQELSMEEAEHRVLQGQSLLVLGSPGTGKTFFCKGLVELLRAQGKKVDICSKTHSASSRAGGCTADHWLRRHVIHGACNVDCLWIDEIGQLDIELLATVNRLTYLGTQLLISGDFAQFAPIGNSWRGSPVPKDALAQSRLLHTLAGGNRLCLTECKISDHELFGFYTRLIPGGNLFGLPIQSAVNQAREKFTYQGICQLNLVLSHRKRVELNRRCNLHFKAQDAIYLPCSLQKRVALNVPQPMWVWPGLALLGCLPLERQGIRNGVEYHVAAVNETTVTLGNGPVLTHEQAVAWLRLPYSMTYASVQGRETEGSLALHDCDKMATSPGVICMWGSRGPSDPRA